MLILLGFDRLHRISIRFYLVLLAFTDFYQLLLAFTGFLFDRTGFG